MNLTYWQDIFKEKAKKMPYEDFIIYLCSWVSFALYKNKGLISRFPETSRVTISSRQEYLESIDTLTFKNKEYDFSKEFFENFADLFQSVKFPSTLFYGTNENSDYCESPVNAKNAYLCNLVLGSEQVFYSLFVRFNCRNIYNSLFVSNNSDSIYFCRAIQESYQVFYSAYINSSSNIWFSTNLIGCRECIFCNNLENVEYCINNKSYPQKEYDKEKEKILKQKSLFLDWYKKNPNSGLNLLSTNVQGTSIVQSENVENGKYVSNTKNARNVILVGSPQGCENIYSSFSAGSGGSSDLYLAVSIGDNSHHIFCSHCIGSSTNIFYCIYLEGCSFCLGCIGLKNKSYCILNKQYSKEEWEQTTENIFLKMQQAGSLGIFFPPAINPLYFNDTIAGLLSKMDKSGAEGKGFLWRNDTFKVGIFSDKDTIQVKDIKKYEGFDIRERWSISEEITKKVIVDGEGNLYKILPEERIFLEKFGLPIPEIHWIERSKINFSF